ncbi:TerD family protein [Candidatus Thiothrix anitrata]|uniref:TerD family protein n=1 Tax=Candidatus Thiothrix anitrata TaxID=2823902 RepID=A0ABX7X0H8_9GAMM|nr:TerD family protein [Candidatus Thiothrix anitrata]QTR49370.1 TerD family protein [Candidatus Thiothrix anitrata]
MAVSLSKGQRISLEKTGGGGLSKVRMGLGWDPAEAPKKSGFFGSMFGGGAAADIDLDASCLLLDAQKNLLDVVWFRQLQSRDGSISHSGDNLTGEGDGDDEVIFVDLTRLPRNVAHLAFTVCSFRGQTFNEVAGAFCRLVDDSNNTEMAKFNLSDKGAHTGVVMAVVSRNGAGWEMKAVGTPTAGAVANDMMPAVLAAL